MQRRASPCFLTLVLILSAPHSLSAEPHNYAAPSSEDEVRDTEKKELDPNMILTPAPTPVRMKHEALDKGYFPYRQAFTLRAGLVQDNDENPYLLGFMYLIPNRRSPQLEAGIDLLSDNRGHINLGIRWTMNEFGYFRPFYKGGLTCEIDPDDQLAGLVKVESYLLRAGVGLEYTFKRPISLRLEGEGTLGTEESAFYVSAGTSWAW